MSLPAERIHYGGKKIIVCVVTAALILAMLNIVSIPPSHWSTDGIFVDDEDSAAGLDEAALFDEMFDLNSVVEISVDISKEQLAALQADYDYYRANQNRSAICRIADSVTIKVNGRKYVIDEVGIKLKGATSRRRFYNDILGIYNPVHFRLCFDCTFDASEDYGINTKVWKSDEKREKRLNRTFATMKSIELKWNITLDNTYVRTLYAHEMFRDFGIPTQLCRLSTLTLGGCRMGVYRMYEPVDEGFIHRYFPEEDWGGDLYKVRWAKKIGAIIRPVIPTVFAPKDGTHTTILTSRPIWTPVTTVPSCAFWKRSTARM